MTTDLGQGDASTPYLDVAPAAGDTAVTLQVRPPAGDPYAVTMTAGPLTPIPDTDPVEHTQRWTADTPVTYTQPGRWVLHYDVTGTGEGAEDVEVYVVASPIAGGPTWLPGRSRVAAYVPDRTLVRSMSTVTGGQDAYALTFTPETRPTGLQVDRLIADGAAWVGSRLAPLHPTSEQAAAVCVAIFCAAMIERTWPDDDQALQRAKDLEARLDRMLTDLMASNMNANDQDAGTGAFAVDIVPLHSFPPAPVHGDWLL